MEIAEIYRMIDHTALKPELTKSGLHRCCDEALEASAAAVCIPPSFVTEARAYLDGRLPVCTVAGFPTGYSVTSVKCFEVLNAVKNGADEIDMVINIGWMKDGRYDDVLDEILAARDICAEKILKVIIETCKLTDGEKIRLCAIASEAGADFIKTSTGFGEGGARMADVVLMKKHMRPDLKLKVAGGICDLEDAMQFIELGADRIGSSSILRKM